MKLIEEIRLSEHSGAKLKISETTNRMTLFIKSTSGKECTQEEWAKLQETIDQFEKKGTHCSVVITTDNGNFIPSFQYLEKWIDLFTNNETFFKHQTRCVAFICGNTVLYNTLQLFLSTCKKSDIEIHIVRDKKELGKYI
jgi:hypothetical protein